MSVQVSVVQQPLRAKSEASPHSQHVWTWLFGCLAVCVFVCSGLSGVATLQRLTGCGVTGTRMRYDHAPLVSLPACQLGHLLAC
jgi:hypothetical protein